MSSKRRRVRRLTKKVAAQSAKRAPRRRRKPVNPKTFIESSHYMDAKDALYPNVLDIFTELNSGAYIEAVLCGAIGWGKTTVALYTICYHLYLISCMKNPQKEFRLDKASPIVFILQSITANSVVNIMYLTLREMILLSPYFNNHFQFDKKLQKELQFPNNIIVRPVTGNHTSTIGQNIIGGILDEVNFMSVIPHSKRALGGLPYDQANENYLSIDRRRRSRFLRMGQLPGILCLTSSERHGGQFTDRKREEAQKQLAETGESNIFVASKRVWETKPKGTFSDEKFELFIGDQTRQPRIINQEDPQIPKEDAKLIHKIPMDFIDKFQIDIRNAIRDIAGLPTIGISSFMPDLELIAASFGRFQSILSRESCDFEKTTVELLPNRIKRGDEPRFVHVDSSLSRDSTGIACGWVPNFVRVKRGEEEYEVFPLIIIDFVLEVCPPLDSEINFEKIRSLLYKIRNSDVNITWVTMDSFQSKDSIQILRHKGFITGNRSMDKTSLPYDVTKTAIYDKRVFIPNHTKAQRELINLERDQETGRIDHPAHGSKDLSDAIAGVIYGLTFMGDIWINHNIPLIDFPPSLQSALESEKPVSTQRSDDDWE